MELNALSIAISAAGLIGIIVALWHILLWSKNLNRYGYPKYLPRDDEVAWAMVMASPIRIWRYRDNKYITFDNWDLGILKMFPGIQNRYGLTPQITDVVLVPKKFGGQWAVVITRELQNNRFVTTFLGEFRNGKIRRSRSRENIIFIS